MLLQEGPADTLGYMLLGYGVILGIMAVYLVNLLLRFRNLRQDRALLEDLVDETEQSAQ
ncbi:MAG TPA: hypothetical protein VGA52_08180 [Anaerolineales bacterium]|jgi:hypothetical protein